jgi:hypothetical protein
MEKMLNLSHLLFTLINLDLKKEKGWTRNQLSLHILKVRDKLWVNKVSMIKVKWEVKDKVWDLDIKVKVKVIVEEIMMKTKMMIKKKSQWMK